MDDCPYNRIITDYSGSFFSPKIDKFFLKVGEDFRDEVKQFIVNFADKVKDHNNG